MSTELSWPELSTELSTGLSWPELSTAANPPETSPAASPSTVVWFPPTAGGVVVDDDDAATGAAGAAGRIAAVVADADQAAAAVSADRAASGAAAHVDVVDDGSVVVGDDVAARGLIAAVVDVVVLADVDVGVVDVAGADVLVVVADHVSVTLDIGRVDVACGSGVDHAAVVGGVAGLVPEGDVTEVQVEVADTLLLVLARRVGQVGLGAQEAGVVVRQQVGLALRGEGDAVGLGNGLLQSEDRIAAAVDESRQAPPWRRPPAPEQRVTLETLAAAMERPGSVMNSWARTGSRKRSRSQSITFVISLSFGHVVGERVTGLSGELMTTLWSARRR